MSMETKVCSKCGEEKPTEAFPKSSYMLKDGNYRVASQCKACRSLYHREWYGQNSESVKSRSKAWKRANPSKRNTNLKNWRSRRRFLVALQSSRQAAKKHDGMSCTATAEEIEAAFTGKCHICGVPESECDRRLHLDHDHDTGAFRGWLCARCNMVLGRVCHSPELLLAMSSYVHEAACTR